MERAKALQPCGGKGVGPAVDGLEIFNALQLNKGSLLGRFGRPAQLASELLMDHGLAACVASDAHSAMERTTYMEEIRRYLTDRWGGDYARLLLEENPSRILAGRELLGYEPIPID